ncbi:hypothetical protein H4R18_005181 [Coemansia javaensis]|uniref:GH18 domain-containing protein n=1 Tax=Coemansia javaensis TaxID=2761396 RepID=A0A9W8H3Y6_9FUNG|nr:hypothetical protein H4R18_005181 [Coemansia javaensis]
MLHLLRPATLCAGAVLLWAAARAEPEAAAHSCGPSSRYVVGYYQSWKRQSLMNIDWSRLSHLNVAFGIPTDSGDFTFDGEWFLPHLVREARKSSTKIALSIGGWTGSNRLSTIMGDVHKRGALVRAIGTFIEQHELDGVDIDWEYVGRQGSKCNKSSPDDPANFLRFLRALRASLSARFSGTEKIISLAVRVQPFEDAGGPLKDVSPFAEYVDFASIQAFDINGPWSNVTGPSAPLEHQRGRGAPFSLKQAVDQWLAAKWPADKLVAGVSFHGHSLTTRDVLTAKDGAEMYVPFDSAVPQGDDEDALWYDVCENVNSMSGVWQYKHLRDQGILKTANTTGDEWIRMWDEKSSTPWLYSPQIRRFISYDDPASLEKKVELARTRGLKGIMAWSLHADYNNELLSTLGRIGPLCRGPRTDSDQPASSSSSSDQSSSTTSSWTPTAPFASLPSQGVQSNTAPESHTEASSTAAAAAPETSASPAASSPAESPASAPAPESSSSAESPAFAPAPESSSSAEAASSPTEPQGKSILFDSMGMPYMMINGHSTAMPDGVAEKLMQIGESTASAGSSSSSGGNKLPGGPLAMPVADSLKTAHLSGFVGGPSRPGLAGATSIFDTAAAPTHNPESAADFQVSVPGFAATFFLALDTTSQPSGLVATTVIPVSQMLASAKTGTPLDLSASPATDSATSSSKTDPLATAASASDATPTTPPA